MAKKVDTSTFDADFIIGQIKPDNRDILPPSESEPISEEKVLSEQEDIANHPPQEVRESPSRRKRGQQSAGFKETFLKRNEIKTRQCVYISHRVHSLIVRLVRTLVE